MTETLLFEPEVEALVREIAADPRSSLLKVARPAVVKSLYSREAEVSALATGLTSAERHLLSVFRCEAAKLLREACIYRLATHPEAGFVHSRQLTPSRVLEIPKPKAWRLRARATAADAREYRDNLDGLELLEACVTTNTLGTVSVAQLAAASLRLEPTDQARIYPAVEMLHEDRCEPAIESLEAVLSGAPSPWHAAWAWTNIGWARSALQQYELAVVAYRRGATIEPDLFPAARGWLLVACALGRRDEAKYVAEGLDSRFHGGSVCASSLERIGRRARFPATYRRHARRLEKSVGPLAREILHAVA